MTTQEFNGLKRHLWGTAAALCIAFFGQTVTAVWWAAALTTRVNYIERDVAECSRRVHAIEIGRSPATPDP